ncbi:Uncharacterised protein [Mycobacteroides abscessus subsp. abscessus]|nr:Uncharacterised protein [Mycobacteroides abscessus subsp. abscessus]
MELQSRHTHQYAISTRSHRSVEGFDRARITENTRKSREIE